MDSTLESFFKEINEIAPPKPSKEECLWKECFDELTGYAYYWNTKTDEVTWEVPANYKPQKKTKSPEKPSEKKSNLYVPAPRFPSTSAKIPEQPVKIYSIGNTTPKNKSQANGSRDTEKSKFPKRSYKQQSDSEDEKITLISSYGGDTESESDEEPVHKKPKDVKSNKNSSIRDSGASDDDDDIDILTKIQKRAQELKALGGDLPPEVAKIADIPKNEPETQKTEEKKAGIEGFSLVAGYSDSEEENEEIKTVFKTQPEPQPQKSHSTLFPITKPIDVKDFMQPKIEETKTETTEFDTKSFQRKRRIDVALVNTAKKKDNSENDNGRKGFGFSSDSKPTDVEKGSLYPGFSKGGVMFVKSDVLNPVPAKLDESGCDSTKTEDKTINRQDIVDMYNTLVEKLGFLNEGRPEVSPTQVMLIQAQTLFEAMREDGLKPKYLQKWLTDTCSELIKLEKEATPEGWLLQWDRTHKRYYYLQRATGVSQWEYPTASATTAAQSIAPALTTQHDDDAMDISTTPPPEQVIRMSPPLPPMIRSPTPPPPPVISRLEDEEEERRIVTVLPDVPLPPEPPPPPPVPSSVNGEPLPPGVDLPDVNYDKDQENKSDPLHSALNSFYSEVAAIDTPKSVSPQPPLPPEEPPENVVETNGEKKKRKKVKLAPGLSLKKKGVSQLVEKWKNVQQQYND